MIQPKITFIINKKPYTLSATDIESIRSIPAVDRQQLIALLEAIKRLESPGHASARPLAATASTISQAAPTVAEAGFASAHQYTGAERLGSGDVDALMAQLIMEDKRNQKPGLTKQSIQKWTAVTAVIVFLLVLIL